MTNLPFILSNAERPKLRRLVFRELGHGIIYAKSGKKIASLLGLSDDRKVRLVIEELIEEGIPIASSVASDGGFFICASEHEAHDYIHTLQSRASEINKRLKAFRLACEKKGFTVPEQTKLL